MEEHNKIIPKMVKDLGMLYPKETSKVKRHFGIFICPYCGKEFKAQIYAIKKGEIKSCRCLLKEPTTFTHKDTKTPLYRRWADMRNRCSNPNNYSYDRYGALGIKVYEEWQKYENFKEWALASGFKEELTIDRIDVKGDYTPTNCRWVDRKVQARNKRVIQSNNTSGYKGVRKRKGKNAYEVYINVNYKSTYLGYFKDKLEGAKAYDRYIIKNNLEHSLNGVLTPEEIEEIKKDSKTDKKD